MGEVWKYVEGLAKARSQEQHLDAAEDAVKRVEVEAMVDRELPNSHSMQNIIIRYMEVLSRRTEALKVALEKGADVLIHCATPRPPVLRSSQSAPWQPRRIGTWTN